MYSHVRIRMTELFCSVLKICNFKKKMKKMDDRIRYLSKCTIICYLYHPAIVQYLLDWWELILIITHTLNIIMLRVTFNNGK